MVTGPDSDQLAVVIDSAADVPSVERTPGVWRLVPDRWGTICDCGEHDRELVRTALHDSEVVAAAPTVSDLRAVYGELAHHPLVLSVHSSRAVSPAVLAATHAAIDFPNVQVIETTVAGVGTGLLAVRLQQLAASGADTATLVAYAQAHRERIRFVAVPDRVDPVGRQRIAAAMLLTGRPWLTTQRGSIVSRGRVRNRARAVTAVGRYVREHSSDGRPMHLAVGHGDAASAVEAFLDIVERERPEAHTQLVGRVGPRLVRRMGSRGVALAWIMDSELDDREGP